MPVQTSSFLEEQVLAMLRQHGFDKLTPADQEAYFPQFLAEAERRFGLAVAPHLDKAASKEFTTLVQSDASPDAWHAFWNTHVPNFPQVIQQTLEAYGKEVAVAFNQ